MSTLESEVLYITFVKDDIPLLELNLSVEGMAYDSVLFSGFLSAIKTFSQSFSNRNLKVIDQGDVKIAFEESSLVSAYYMTTEVSLSLSTKIKNLLKLFEDRFRFILENPDPGALDLSTFEAFKENILKNLSSQLIKNYYIVKPTGKTPTSTIPNNIFPVISMVDGKRTITQIAKELNLDIENVTDKIIYLKSKDLISFLIFVGPYDIPHLSADGMAKLFNPSEDYKEMLSRLGKDNFKAIKSIDGKATVTQLAEMNSLNLSDMKKIINILLTKGYIDLTSEELIWCLILESLYNSIILNIKKLMGKRGISHFFNILDQEEHPLISLIKFTEDRVASFDAIKIHAEGMKELNIRELQELFISPILKTFESLQNDVGEKYTVKLKSRLLADMKRIYGSNRIIEIENILG